MIHDNLKINDKGNLAFANCDTTTLAKKYGTPLMVMDEDRVRSHIRTYKNAMEKSFGAKAMPLYASKALCFKGMYKIAKEEGIGIDVVSSGEIYTAVLAGFPMEKAFFHGNNKTDQDIKYAINSKVGFFVADNIEELDAIDNYAKIANIKQKVLLRLTPGIDPDTHKAVCTGNIDSKFGQAIGTNQADFITTYALSKKNIELKGFHCHIGSQIFDCQPFIDAADIMLNFIAEIDKKYGYMAEYLNLGGGFGVRYTKDNPQIDYEQNIIKISDHIKELCKKYDIKMPIILMEPGRSLVADAGITLYTVGSVKEIPGFKNYVSIDGGMTDNPRYALYQSPYTVLVANKASKKADYKCTIAGRCCESGDLIQEDVTITKPQRGDVLAVLVTGAYNYAMSSNYNKIPRPPIVMVSNGKDSLAVRRETIEDLARLDV
ncbi:MAG: diaminopimelate decarboxylase [Clostridiales bacterium]|nr:diaminopimelate decarboxylase [Clostridiales bacterium]